MLDLFVPAMELEVPKLPIVYFGIRITSLEHIPITNVPPLISQIKIWATSKYTSLFSAKCKEGPCVPAPKPLTPQKGITCHPIVSDLWLLPNKEMKQNM